MNLITNSIPNYRRNKFEIRVMLPQLLNIIDGYGYIAGGFAAYACSKHESYDDIDVFCNDVFAFQFLKDIFEKEQNIKILKKESKYSIYYGYILKSNHFVINLVKPQKNTLNILVGPPEKVITNFDFLNIACYIKDENTCVSLVDLESLNSRKILTVNYGAVGRSNPLLMLKRIIKYTKKGYHISNVQLLQFYQKLNNAGSEDFSKKADDVLNQMVETDALLSDEFYNLFNE